jgi:hypothetical protein
MKRAAAAPRRLCRAVVLLTVATVVHTNWVTPVQAAQIGPLVQVSSDPFTTPGFQHRTEVEPDILAEGRTIVAAFQVGRADEGGSVGIGLATSANGGGTWSAMVLGGATIPTGGTYGRASDPSVAYDAGTRTWLVGYLGVTVTGRFQEPTRSAIQVARSVGGTDSFGEPITIARAPRGLFYDKPWIVCDGHRESPFFGRCYAVWNEIGLRNGPFDLLLTSTSMDGGANWSPPVRTADRARGFGAIPVARPDGSVVVPYLNTEHPIHPRIEAFLSTDGGASWGSSFTIAVPRRADRDVPVRDPGFPSVAVDEAGSIFAAWSDCRFEPRCAVDDIVLSRSADGRTWMTPILATKGQPSNRTSLLTPGLAVSRRGSATWIALLYYAVAGRRCAGLFRPNSCTITIGYVSSRDDGRTWSSPSALGWPMRPGWFPATRQGYMWGDYVTDAILGNGKAVAVLPLARRPGGALDVAMYAPARGLPIQGRRS